mmetsp:Transcript_36769/g.56495  ORF Transcript_36769/g.56495 Transcript_36769/m.56495 type:complete len:85 (-) Transcript_36769:651-905(-)
MFLALKILMCDAVVQLFYFLLCQLMHIQLDLVIVALNHVLLTFSIFVTASTTRSYWYTVRINAAEAWPPGNHFMTFVVLQGSPC